jgi:hypothetical protein
VDPDELSVQGSEQQAFRCASFSLREAAITLVQLVGAANGDSGALRTRLETHGEGPYSLTLRVPVTSLPEQNGWERLDASLTHGAQIGLVAWEGRPEVHTRGMQT